MPAPLHIALILLAAYLLGSVSGSLWMGRRRGIDIRELGSGNAGGTNALRTQGVAFAAGTVAIDVGKGALAALLGRLLPPEALLDHVQMGYAAAFAAMLGHVWPLWYGFRGGKAAATMVGGLAVMWPGSLPLLLAVWAGVVLLSGYVGLATLAAAASLPLAAWWGGASQARWVFALASLLLLLFTHRGNLGRMWRGEESRFGRARLLHRILRRGGE